MTQPEVIILIPVMQPSTAVSDRVKAVIAKRAAKLLSLEDFRQEIRKSSDVELAQISRLVVETTEDRTAEAYESEAAKSMAEQESARYCVQIDFDLQTQAQLAQAAACYDLTPAQFIKQAMEHTLARRAEFLAEVTADEVRNGGSPI